MSLFNVVNDQAQFDAASNVSSDVHGAGIRFTQAGAARVTTTAGTFFNQGIPMSDSGQVAIVDATAGLPADTTYLNGLPISGNKVCVSRNASSVVSNGLPFDSNGAIAGAINFDLNFIGTDTLDPQVTFTRASTATRSDQNGVLQTVASGVARSNNNQDYDPVTLAPRGFLVEEQRTNSIRNNTMQGAVAGTPGTPPTNWSFTSGSVNGITRTIVGTGTENGITYIDFQYAGTASGAGNMSIVAEPNNQVVAVQNQVWTFTCYAKLVAGSFANTTARTLFINSYTAAGAFDANAASPSSNFPVGGPTSAALNTQRYFYTGTLASATTAFVNSGVFITYNAGAVIDFTIRIGLPQLELGAFATSVIPTTTTALTRSEDRASINTMSPWYNASASTIYAEHFRPLPTPAGSFPRAVDFISTATSDKLSINHVDNRLTVSSQDIYPSGLSWPFTSVNANANNVIKHAIAATVGSGRYAVNGTLGGSDYAIPSIPTLDQVVIGSGKGFFGISTLNGWVRRVTYYPRRLSNAELVSITS